jgi:hypothetical protein
MYANEEGEEEVEDFRNSEWLVLSKLCLNVFFSQGKKERRPLDRSARTQICTAQFGLGGAVLGSTLSCVLYVVRARNKVGWRFCIRNSREQQK